jgi:high-affinity K+ transport system ATPase subunit B
MDMIPSTAKNVNLAVLKECFTILFCVILVAVSLWGIWQLLHLKEELTLPEYIGNWVVALMTSVGGVAIGIASVNRIRHRQFALNSNPKQEQENAAHRHKTFRLTK